MELRFPVELAAQYHGPTQRVRIMSEAWIERNLFCLSCDSDALHRERANTKTLDFRCTSCASLYELKSSSTPIGRRLPDGAYKAMVETMESGKTPHFLTLHYDPRLWVVTNLLAIPGFALTLSAIHCRKPLSMTARRAGWVGCDIILGDIPPDARVAIVQDGRSIPKKIVREKFAKLKPLAAMRLPQRGWTLDVLTVVRDLRKSEFRLADVLGHEDRLQELHPQNRHVPDKIRQQLQVLRDLGFLTFVSRGVYRLRSL